MVECNFGCCRSATFDTVTHCNTDEHLRLLPIQPREICFPSKLGLNKFVRKTNKNKQTVLSDWTVSRTCLTDDVQLAADFLPVEAQKH